MFNCAKVEINIPKYKSVLLNWDNNINWPGSKEDPGSGLWFIETDEFKESNQDRVEEKTK